MNLANRLKLFRLDFCVNTKRKTKREELRYFYEVPSQEIKPLVQSLTNVFILNLFKKKIDSKIKKITKPKIGLTDSNRKQRNKKRLVEIKNKKLKIKAEKKENMKKKEVLYKLAKGIK